MNAIIMWSIIGVVLAAILGIGIFWIVKICRMSPEDRKKTIVVFLEGCVTMAEQEIGAGHGDEKIKLVEDYFNKNAGWFIKILLMISGKDNLKDLIELALSEAKKAFKK